MYVLAKFQLCIQKAFEVTALQSSSNRKIDLYSMFRENKLQALPGSNHWPLPSLRTRWVKKLTDFFSKYAIIYPMYFNALY